MEKTLVNTDANGASKNVKDIVFWGNGDTFKLISKASSVAEAITFVPGVRIKEEYNTEQVATVTSRKLVKI